MGKMEKNLKITPLGGQEEIGLNSLVIETEEDTLVIDLGNNFDDGHLGVNFYVPNVSSLSSQISKIRGIFLTHGHYDHRGGLPFLIEALGYPPIYASPFTLALVEQDLKKLGIRKHARLMPLHPRQEVKLGQIKVKAIHLTHSIVGTYGYFLKTEAGNLFHTGDFKFDDTPFQEDPPDYQSLEEIGREGVLVAFVDSTRANYEGHSQSETSISQNLEKIIQQAQGRVIVTTFAQMLVRINQIGLIAQKYGREIFVRGRTMERTTALGQEMNILDRRLRLRDAEEMKNFDDKNILLFATGSQGEERAALTRMAEAKKGSLKIKPTDTVIVSSSSIPTNLLAIQKLIDSLADHGCRVVTDDIVDIHAGGHGHQEEIIKMIQFLKPKFLFPVEGYISFRQRMGEIAQSLGYGKNRVILVKNHQEVTVNQNGFQKSSPQPELPKVVIADQLIKDGAEIVSQRREVADQGLLTVFVNQKRRSFYFSPWGVPSLIFNQIRKNFKKGKIPFRDPDQIKKAIEKWLRIKFDEDLVPVVKVELIN
jgi:ribonuclease J